MSNNIEYSLENVKVNPNSGFVGAGGSLPLIDPVMEPGFLFLGWYVKVNETKKYIHSVSISDIPDSGSLVIYSDSMARTTVGIYGRTISEMSDPKYILTVDELDSTKTRSLSAITKSDLASALVTHTSVVNEVIGDINDETSSSVTLDISGVRDEYYLNLLPKVTKVLISLNNTQSTGTVVIHLSKYSYEYNQGIIEVTISGYTNVYSMSIGSTMVLKYDTKRALAKVDVYKAVESNLKIEEVVNDILEYRNYVHVGHLNMTPGKSPAIVELSKVGMSEYADFNYKSVNLYFNNAEYNSSTDVATLQGKQGYFNLIDPQVTKASIDKDTLKFEITYDKIPAYVDNEAKNNPLSKYTEGIPVRLVMVR